MLGSSREEITDWLSDAVRVRVRVPPVSGRANEAVVALLAVRLRIDTSSISVVSGHSSPAKVVDVDGLDNDAIRGSVSPRSTWTTR